MTESPSGGTAPEAAGTSTPPFPRATLLRDLPSTRLWVLPVAALFLVAGLGIASLGRKPLTVRVQFRAGHGIKTGDAVKFRGIDVGRVGEVRLSPDLRGVDLRLQIENAYRGLTAQGSAFWIVHPQAGLYGVQGLDTLIGPRYIGVLPGEGPPRTEFIGQEEAPPAEAPPGGLEITLQAGSRGSLRPGAPILFRQCQVGAVLAVGLAPDAVGVDVRVLVEPRFAGLVRDNSRFWNASGLAFDLGLLRGLTLDMESLQTVLAGGICLATPDPAGSEVKPGHRFPLHARPEPEWLAWKPALWLGDRLLPPGTPLPELVRVQTSWTESRLAGLWTEQHVRRAWALPLAGGLLCPADLAVDAGNGSPLPIQGLGRTWRIAPAPSGEAVPFLRLTDPAAGTLPTAWPDGRRRHPTAPEDACAVGDPQTPPLPLQASRLTAAPDGSWLVDPALGLPPAWHGAAVLALADGKVLGLLHLEAGRPARVVLLPEKLP
ncbi:MAG: MCE family protein [Candidatus Riflebacteria bacterium]|nr:MCE family protein [Candidatus Riflebacteria bacterium]